MVFLVYCFSKKGLTSIRGGLKVTAGHTLPLFSCRAIVQFEICVHSISTEPKIKIFMYEQ